MKRLLSQHYLHKHYVGKVKSSSLAYNRCKTQDKRPLDRDRDGSQCQHDTMIMIKLFGRIPWLHRQESFLLVWRRHQCLSGSLLNGHQSQVLRWLQVRPRTFHLARMLTPMPMEPWATTKKALSYSKCSGYTSFCLVPYPMAACPEFHIGQAENFLPCPQILD